MGEKMVYLRCWEREIEGSKREGGLECLAKCLEEKGD
jgi:hypothetical protein